MEELSKTLVNKYGELVKINIFGFPSLVLGVIKFTSLKEPIFLVKK